jgi:hypothetical protein
LNKVYIVKKKKKKEANTRKEGREKYIKKGNIYMSKAA